MLLFGNIGETTVIRSIVSPGGTYYAEIIDDDQGALGGNTLVDVNCLVIDSVEYSVE